VVADELELHFAVSGTPEYALARWKSEPPAAVRGMELVDEAYNSLTYESRYYDWPAKIMFVTTFGVGLLFKDMMVSQHKVTVRFDPEGAGRSTVTVLGKLPAERRAAFGALAAQSGGTTGLRVGA
jgi:hypothetical protein